MNLVSKTYWAGTPFNMRRPPADYAVESLLLKAPDGREHRGLLWTARKAPKPKTGAVVMHPRGDFQHHYVIPRLVEAGIEPSVGSVGDSYDNALAETINGLYKAEVIHRNGPWRSFEAVEFATLKWVDWFNNRRLLEPIGNIPPAEAEERYHAMLNEQKLAA